MHARKKSFFWKKKYLLRCRDISVRSATGLVRASDVTVTQSAMSPQLHRQVLFVHTSVGFCSEATAEEGPLPSRPVADVGPALYRLFDALVWRERR